MDLSGQNIEPDAIGDFQQQTFFFLPHFDAYKYRPLGNLNVQTATNSNSGQVPLLLHNISSRIRFSCPLITEFGQKIYSFYIPMA